MYTLHIPCLILVLITFVECLSLYRPLPIHPHLPIYPVKPVKPVKPKYPRNCPPVCLIFCPNGNVLDKNGCPTCRCIPDKPNADVCSLPKVVGPCKAAFPRYFYNKKTGRCEKFIYGGCGANKNNFKTLTECQEKCDPCRLPKKVGPCEALIPRYFYNNKTRRCEKFFFGGCNANKNNFDTLQKCKETCENSRRKLIKYPPVLHAY